MTFHTAFAGGPHRPMPGHPFSAATRTLAAAAAALLLALAGCGGSAQTTGAPVSSSPALGSATLSWSAPTTNVDGSPLTTLAGFRVYYGTVPGEYAGINVGDTTSYRFHNLTPGKTYYFTVTAVDQYGDESDYSAVVSKLIT